MTYHKFRLTFGQEKVFPRESVKTEIKIIAAEYLKLTFMKIYNLIFEKEPNIIGTGKQ